jgi:hypothetical protein
LIFTNIEVNKQVVRDLLLFNDGAGDLTIESLKIIGDTKRIFTLLDTPVMPFIMEPGRDKGKKLKIQFLADTSGQFSARLEVNSPDADNVDANGNFYVNIINQVLEPNVRFDCQGGRLDFGLVEKGQSSTLTCQLFNRGNANLVIRGVIYVPEKGSANDFKWDEPQFPAELAPSDTNSLTVKITYSPSDYPPREDQGEFVLDTNMVIKHDDEKPRLRVLGMTAVPLIELIPLYGTCLTDANCKSLDSRLACSEDEISKKMMCLSSKSETPFLKFPLTSKGRTTQRSFLIRSNGDRPVKIDQISLDASSSNDFRVVLQGVQLPLMLDPQQEKEITVEYAPSDEVEDAGQLIVGNNSGNQPQARLLLEAASRGCNLDVQPRKHQFKGPQPLTVSIINLGNESCMLSKVSLKSNKNDPFTMLPTPQPNQTIAPNGRIDFLVNFKPPDNNEYKDVILIESSDPDEPVIELELIGKVTGSRECELNAKPTRLVFGLVGLGRSKKLQVEIENNGWGDCTINSLNIQGTNPPSHNAFQLGSQIQPPINIQSSKNIHIDVSYTPPEEKGYDGKLIIASNDAQNPKYEINLTGTSGTLCLEVVPQSMDFGSSKFGCATPTRQIQVFNIGAAKCSESIKVTKIGLSSETTPEFRIMSAPPTPKTLKTGESLEIGMSYKPKEIGPDRGVLEIENDVAGQSPVSVTLSGEGVATDEQKDVFRQLNRPLTDIMFVIDDSCSMYNNQDSLARNIQSFIDWAVRLNVDYQIMITTTDTEGSKFPAGCAQGTYKLITPQTPNPAQEFANNARVGTVGSATEKGLEAAYRALIPPTSEDPKCNRGFYRQDASLSMIFVSDEPDQSPQTVQFYVSFFKSLKGYRNLDLIRASAIVGPPPNGCQGGSAGSATADFRYWETAKELKGVQESICNPNWAGSLSNIGSITFGYRTQFFLSRQADPKTLQVKVNGTTVKEDSDDGWQYDPTNNSVNFSKSQIPPPGATIQIEYKAICLP